MVAPKLHRPPMVGGFAFLLACDIRLKRDHDVCAGRMGIVSEGPGIGTLQALRN